MHKAIASDADSPGFEPRRGLLFFLFYLKGLCHGFLASLLTAKIYICAAGKARQIMAYFC